MNLSGGTSPVSGVASGGVLPLQRSPRTLYPSAVDTREEFFVVECLLEAVLQSQPLRSLSVYVRCEKTKTVASTLFGAIHGDIGILDQVSPFVPCSGKMLMPRLHVIFKA